MARVGTSQDGTQPGIERLKPFALLAASHARNGEQQADQR